MRKILTFILILTLASSCVVITPGHGKSSTAPGQIKKTTGSQSAKPYAPGQRKKN